MFSVTRPYGYPFVVSTQIAINIFKLALPAMGDSYVMLFGQQTDMHTATITKSVGLVILRSIFSSTFDTVAMYKYSNTIMVCHSGQLNFGSRNIVVFA